MSIRIRTHPAPMPPATVEVTCDECGVLIGTLALVEASFLVTVQTMRREHAEIVHGWRGGEQGVSKVYVLVELDNETEMILGVFSTVELAKAQTTAPWQRVPWAMDEDDTFFSVGANFHQGVPVDWEIYPFVVDAVHAAEASRCD